MDQRVQQRALFVSEFLAKGVKEHKVLFFLTCLSRQIPDFFRFIIPPTGTSALTMTKTYLEDRVPPHSRPQSASRCKLFRGEFWAEFVAPLQVNGKMTTRTVSGTNSTTSARNIVVQSDSQCNAHTSWAGGLANIKGTTVNGGGYSWDPNTPNRVIYKLFISSCCFALGPNTHGLNPQVHLPSFHLRP